MEVKISPTSNKSPREVEGKETSWIVRTIFSVILTLVKLTGLLPLSICLETKSVDFKLISWKTFFSFLRLLAFTFPFLILPFIFYFGGFVEEAAFDAASAATGNSSVKLVQFSKIGQIVEGIEVCVNVLVYILPFALGYFLAKPLENIFRIRFAEHNLNLEKSGFAVKVAVFPLFGFLLFLAGKLMFANSYIRWFLDIEGFSKYHFFLYVTLCTIFLVDFPLHFLLATYEYLFYRNMPSYESLAKRVLKTEDPRLLLKRIEELTVFMKNTQDGFGFFLLVDLTLMLLYWLIHTFKLYFSVQVNLIGSQSGNVYSKLLSAVGH